MTDSSIVDIRRTCMGMLARREHSRQELFSKLVQKDFEPDAVNAVLDEFSEKNLQCDQRFSEAYIRFRLQQGFGPLRIQQELEQRGVNAALIRQGLETYADQFFKSVREVFQKKFGDSPEADFKSRAKQQQFLHYRGFNSDHIRAIYSSSCPQGI